MGGFLLHFLGGRVSTAQVVSDLAFWVYYTVLIKSQEGIILLRKILNRKEP
jgi:hypothetical protein